MKIALLCNGYKTGVNRGAERFSEEFKNHLEKYFDIDILSAIDTKTKTRNQFHIPHRNLRAYQEAYYFGKKLYKDNMLKKYDIIFNNSGFPVSYWCNKERKRSKISFVTRARGGGFEEYLSRIFKPDQMVFLSNHHRNQICYWGKVIPNAIDVSSMKSDHKSLLTHSLEHPIVLSTSALVGFKRISLTINAMYRLGKGTLIQTPDGPMKNIIIKMGQKMLGNRFLYTGKLSRDELLSLYNSADIFVNASRKEAFGVVYLEAMAANLPVVTQEDSRRREIIGMAGLLGNLDDVDYYASLLNRASGIKWGNIPRTQAKRFNWKKTTQLYRKLFEDV